VEIWEEILDRKGLGVTDDFFDSGGHSLKVTKLLARVQQRLGLEAPINLAFKAPTIRQFAEKLLDAARFGISLADEAMVCLHESSAERRLFALPPGTGDALSYLQLAELLKPRAFYGFNFIEADSRLQDYVNLILSVYPRGPYVLLGYSGGGNLAFQVALLLEQRGQEVTDIIMIDSSRRLQTFHIPEEEVMGVAQEFLNHDSIRPYVTNPVLQWKAIRRIQRSYACHAGMVDEGKIRANIHVLQSASPAPPFYDRLGREIVSLPAWAEVTSGAFRVYEAKGDHNHMLSPPYVDENAEVIKKIIEQVKDAGCDR